MRRLGGTSLPLSAATIASSPAIPTVSVACLRLHLHTAPARPNAIALPPHQFDNKHRHNVPTQAAGEPTVGPRAAAGCNCSTAPAACPPSDVASAGHSSAQAAFIAALLSSEEPLTFCLGSKNALCIPAPAAPGAVITPAATVPNSVLEEEEKEEEEEEEEKEKKKEEEEEGPATPPAEEEVQPLLDNSGSISGGEGEDTSSRSSVAAASLPGSRAGAQQLAAGSAEEEKAQAVSGPAGNEQEDDEDDEEEEGAGEELDGDGERMFSFDAEQEVVCSRNAGTAMAAAAAAGPGAAPAHGPTNYFGLFDGQRGPEGAILLMERGERHNHNAVVSLSRVCVGVCVGGGGGWGGVL
jgi:hypothetical protein